MKKNKRPSSPWIFYLFLVPLLVVGLLYFVLPVNATSEREKRNLQGKPEFSIAGYFDGSYQDQVERFFQDQLPLREAMIGLDQGLSRFTSNLFVPGDTQLIVGGPGGDALGEGENLGVDQDDIVTFRPQQPNTETPATTPTQPATDSGSEPSSVATTNPDSSNPGAETTNPVETTEATTPTAEPTDNPGTPDESSTTTTTTTTTTQTEAEEEPDFSIEGLLIQGDRAVELFGYRDAYVESYVALLKRMQSLMPNVNHFSLIAPTAAEFYTPPAYHSGMASQREMIDKVYAQLNPGITSIDIYDTMQAHTDEYIYFRTDHHWTGLGAYYAYQEIAQTMGFQPLALSQMEYGRIEGGFLGSLYGLSQQNPALSSNPDFVEWWEPAVEVEGIAFLNPEMTEGYYIDLIAKEVSAENKYLAFTQGDHGLARFETSTKNGQKIAVLKESYGNALIPYLTSHFEEVYVIDPRRMEMDLPQYMQDQNIGNLLTINYASAVANTIWKNGLSAMLP